MRALLFPGTRTLNHTGLNSQLKVLPGSRKIQFDENAGFRCTAKIIDNFPQQLYSSDRLLLCHGGGLIFCDLRPESRALLISPYAEQQCCDEPFTGTELEARLNTSFKDLAKLRALVPEVALRLECSQGLLLDDEEKTRARIFVLALKKADNEVECATAPDGAVNHATDRNKKNNANKTDSKAEQRQEEDAGTRSEKGAASLVIIEPLRGYEKDADLLTDLLEEIGGRPDATMVQLYQTLRIAPNGYMAKPEIELDPEMTAKECARCIIAAHLKVARTNEPGILADIDTEFLHDYRVSLRKVRSVLSLFKGIYTPKDTEKMADGLSEIMKATNRLRDLDVFLLNRDSYMEMVAESTAPGLELLFAQVGKERGRALQSVVKRLSSKAYQRDFARITGWFNPKKNIEDGPRAKDGAQTTGCRLILKRFNRICKLAAGIDNTTADEEVHRLRIQCKKLRYLMEFFAPLFPAEAIKSLISSLKKLQDMLGDFNDYSVQQQFLRGLLPEGNGSSPTRDIMMAEAIGVLGGVLQMKQRSEKKKIIANLSSFHSPDNQQQFNELFGRKDA